MKYFNGCIKVSATGSRRLKCELCGKETLSLHIREDNVRMCETCYGEDNNIEIINERRQP